MEMNDSRAGWLVSIGQGLAWLATACGVLVSAIFIRGMVLDILVHIGAWHLDALHESGVIAKGLETGNRITAVDFGIIFLLTCLAVWAIVEIDFYLRKSRRKGRLWKGVLKVAGIEAGVIVGSVLLRLLLNA